MSAPLNTLEIDIPRWALPIENNPDARYYGAYGGRGSGKSHFFAEKVIERCVEKETHVVCIREVQKSLSQSVKKLIEAKIESLGLGGMFKVLDNKITCSNGSLIVFQGMQDHTADSIKSLEGFDIAWVEEAQTLSDVSLTMLRPTIRKPGSQIWFGWNPFHRTSAVDKFLRKTKPDNSIVIKVNYSDNPWFPDVLEDERQQDLKGDTDNYNHVWEGHYISNTPTQFIPTKVCVAGNGKHLRDDQFNFAPIIISCDPAWEGADELVIGMRQGLMYRVLERIAVNDNDQVIGSKIAAYEDKYHADAVFIDYGYGTGIVSYGRSMYRTWLGVWANGKSGRPDCVNKRAEMIAEIKDWLEAGGSYEDNDLLEEELIHLEKLPDEGNRIKFPKKSVMFKTLGRSPNDLDALGLTFAHKVTKKVREELRQRRDYDPMDRA